MFKILFEFLLCLMLVLLVVNRLETFTREEWIKPNLKLMERQIEINEERLKVEKRVMEIEENNNNTEL